MPSVKAATRKIQAATAGKGASAIPMTATHINATVAVKLPLPDAFFFSLFSLQQTAQ
jgi:hypothetical protein